jgi:hypothetical protein
VAPRNADRADVADVEAGRGDLVPRLPVEMAVPCDLAVERGKAVLPAREAALAADVFEEGESSARPEHAPDLGECGLRLLDRAEDERDDRGVEGLVLERQGLGLSRDDLNRDRGLGGARLRKRPAMLGSGSTATTRLARS